MVTVTKSFLLPMELIEMVIQESKENERSQSAVVRMALKSYFGQNKNGNN